MSGNISLDRAIDDAGAARAWFTEVVEPLADSFDPANVARYVHLFAEVLERSTSGLRAADLIDRYERIRQPRVFTGPAPDDVFVLSRVTLGADIAIASVMLDGLKRRFPQARIWLAGSQKTHEMFAADPRVGLVEAPYDRSGPVRRRIAASLALADLLDRPGAIVVDPDSRLTQLGLVPVCPESRYFFFESRASLEPGTLSSLAARWMERTFGIGGARAYIAPAPMRLEHAPDIAVSFGVGGNPAKRVPDPFERNLLEALAAMGRAILVDQGAGGEELDRAARASAGLAGIERFQGSFAAFAARIAASRAYLGYDSSGQHAAAALGIPLVAIFAGYPNERFIERWQPSGTGPVTVLRAGDGDAQALVELIRNALLSGAGFQPAGRFSTGRPEAG